MNSHSLVSCAVKNQNPETDRPDYRTPYHQLKARLRARQMWESGIALNSTVARDELVNLVRGVAA